MRFRGELVAAMLASSAGFAQVAAAQPADPAGTTQPAPPASDLRDTFQLQPASQPSDCGDGLAFDCAVAADPLDEATPYALSTWLPGSYLRRLPVADTTHDQVAGYALGATSDGAGPVFGGASGLENRWTIDGAPADNVRTGGADTQIPLSFLDGILVSAGGFSARDRASTGGTIDARLRRGTPDHQVEADVWTSLTAAAATRPIASGSFTVRHLTVDQGPQVTASVVATGPLSIIRGGWYAAGIAPTLSVVDVAWQASRVADANQDGVPDGLPGDVVSIPIERTKLHPLDYSVPAMLRAGVDRGPSHLELTLIGQAARTDQFLANATEPAAGVINSSLTSDAIATWRGNWTDTHARIQVAWHHSGQSQSAYAGSAADLPQQLTSYIPEPLIDDPVLATACNDLSPLDPTPRVTNCPVPFGQFASGGAGLLVERVADRTSATADLAHKLGGHVIRAGGTVENSELVTTSSFTAHEEDLSLFTGELDQRRFYLGNCDDTGLCNYATASELDYRSLYGAAYVEDTYQPLPGLSIDAGVRWELMWVGTRLHLSDGPAPRLGVVWDPLGGGRSRVWANYDRTFEMLPAGLGQTVIQRDMVVDDFSFNGMTSRTHSAGAAFGILSGIQPVVQDEATAGAEVALAGALRITVWGQGRLLRHGLVTMPAGFGNPSGGQIAADRETELAAVQLEMRQPHTTVRTGALWGRTVGTWTGPFDPRLGANQLNTPDWLVDPSNLYGALPTDAGGAAFLEAERTGSIGSVGLTVATRLSVASGTPRDAIANGSDGIIELLPRGSIDASVGRNPVIAQANLRLAARWRGITVTLDLLNVFNRQAPTVIDETYSSDSVRPIQGGSYEDLVFLKSESGAPAVRQTTFQLPTQFQPPLTIALGVHKAF